ncbi:MAG: DUF992 domain-containing protein [Beijerinckiaceae bacterium]
MQTGRRFLMSLFVALAPSAALAQGSSAQIGVLSCDVSRGFGMIVMEKQTMACVYRQAGGAFSERYSGVIETFGIALGGVAAGHLTWGVVASSAGLPLGALAGTYAGVGANASLGVGAGANVLIGGTGRSVSLQPVSVEGQAGLNVAGGVTTITLRPAP